MLVPGCVDKKPSDSLTKVIYPARTDSEKAWMAMQVQVEILQISSVLPDVAERFSADDVIAQSRVGVVHALRDAIQFLAVGAEDFELAAG